MEVDEIILMAKIDLESTREFSIRAEKIDDYYTKFSFHCFYCQYQVHANIAVWDARETLLTFGKHLYSLPNFHDKKCRSLHMSEEKTIDLELPNLFEPGDTEGFEIVSDYDAYWVGKGECPICKDNTKPEIVPGGSFRCQKCGWRN